MFAYYTLFNHRLCQSPKAKWWTNKNQQQFIRTVPNWFNTVRERAIRCQYYTHREYPWPSILSYHPIGRVLCRQCRCLPPWSSTQRSYGQQAETLISVMGYLAHTKPRNSCGARVHWEQGKTQAAGVAPDSCPCCAIINPFQVAAFSLLLY